MTNSNNKHSHGFLSNAFGVAKKISVAGMQVLNNSTSDSVSKITQPAENNKVIEGSARASGTINSQKYDNPQHMLRDYLPNVSKQLLGRRYSQINRVANFVSPQFSDKVSDYFFEQLNQFTSNISSVDTVLDQAGAKNLQELTQDVNRSQRISQALAEQNKWIASVQGAISGATGVIGSAVDVPLSLVMSLRMIYQVGRSYGFELNKETEQEIVQFVFKQIDLGVIAEKQSVLMALKALSNMLQTQDISQLQQMLGSSSDIEAVKKWLSDEDGAVKWSWLNHIPKLSLISKLTPVAGASIGAVYSWKLVEDVNQKAQQIFSHARSYLQQNEGTELSAIAAYEKSIALLDDASPKLLAEQVAVKAPVEALKLDQDIEVANHQTISKVVIKKKTEEAKPDDTEKGEQVQQGLEKLAEKMVEEHEQVEPQQPALSTEEPEFLAEDDLEFEEIETEKSEPAAVKAVQKDESAAVTKKVTKKKS